MLLFVILRKGYSYVSETSDFLASYKQGDIPSHHPFQTSLLSHLCEEISFQHIRIFTEINSSLTGGLITIEIATSDAPAVMNRFGILIKFTESLNCHPKYLLSIHFLFVHFQCQANFIRLTH
jgi:hypothetical protein